MTQFSTEAKKPQLKIWVTSLLGLKSSPDLGITHVLSIRDSNVVEPLPTPAGVEQHFQLVFDDVDSYSLARAGLAPDEVTGVVMPNHKHVREIIRIGKELLTLSQDRPVKLLIHCVAGVSRSTAAAFAIFNLLYEPEQALEETVRSSENGLLILPNDLITRYADEELARHGKMIETLRKFSHQRFVGN